MSPRYHQPSLARESCGLRLGKDQGPAKAGRHVRRASLKTRRATLLGSPFGEAESLALRFETGSADLRWRDTDEVTRLRREDVRRVRRRERAAAGVERDEADA